MGWTRTNEWWRALREVCAELELREGCAELELRGGAGELPWHPRYAEIFGDREGLRRALLYRWTLISQAQGAEPTWSTGERLLHEAELVERHRALVKALTPRQIPAVA
jgi:hypothetical protein